MGKKKGFKLKPNEIKPLKTGLGYCFATNMITIDGKRINFMYRQKPNIDGGSGWSFFSGYESDEYANNPKNIQIYDVNTIANYDPEIIPFLDSPYDSVFERNQKTGKFEQVYDFEFPE